MLYLSIKQNRTFLDSLLVNKGKDYFIFTREISEMLSCPVSGAARQDLDYLEEFLGKAEEMLRKQSRKNFFLNVSYIKIVIIYVVVVK